MNLSLYQVQSLRIIQIVLQEVTGKTILYYFSQASCFNYSEKKFDKILHLKSSNFNMYLNTTSNLYIILTFSFENFPSDIRLNIPKDFLSNINKALSLIINLLPKTSELIQSKICKLLKFIISRIDINHYALLHHFRCNLIR